MSIFRRRLIAGVGDNRPIIERLPAQGNLVALWDAADINSWSGSGSWQNLIPSPADGAAQSAYNLQLGSTSGSDANDPTFSGTPGGLSSSEYWSLSSTTGFELPANTTFTNSMHHGNAEWEIGYIIDLGATPGTTWYLASTVTGGSSGNRGFFNYATWSMYIAASASNVLTNWTPGTGFKRFTWGFDGDAATGPWQYSIDGTQTTNSTANTNTDNSSTADRTLMVCNGNGYGSGVPGGKLYAVVLWNKRLTSGEVTTFNDAFASRFGY